MADDAFDTIILIAVIALFVPIMAALAIPFYYHNVGGFDTQIEKTALQSESIIVPVERKMTDTDMILSLVVADRYTPMPKKVRLNGVTEINIDNAFLGNKEVYLQQAAAQLPKDVEMEMDLYSGPTGMRFWELHQ